MTRLAERVDVRSDLWIAFVQPSKLGSSMETESKKEIKHNHILNMYYQAALNKTEINDPYFEGMWNSALIAIRALGDEVIRLEKLAAEYEEDSIFLSYLRAGGVDNWDGYSDAIKACYVGDDE